MSLEEMSAGVLGVVILAGGEGRRMGGQDKGWCEFQGKPFIELVLAQIQQQASELPEPVQIVISANRNLEQYQALGYPVITDLRNGFHGPLAGIESALDYGIKHGIERWISCPVDCLQLPQNYLMSMSSESADLPSVMTVEARQHYAHCAVNIAHLAGLQNYLQEGKRSIKGWLNEGVHSCSCPHSLIDFSADSVNVQQLNCNRL